MLFVACGYELQEHKTHIPCNGHARTASSLQLPSMFILMLLARWETRIYGILSLRLKRAIHFQAGELETTHASRLTPHEFKHLFFGFLLRSPAIVYRYPGTPDRFG